jgi:hypothetical protein
MVASGAVSLPNLFERSARLRAGEEPKPSMPELLDALHEDVGATSIRDTTRAADGEHAPPLLLGRRTPRWYGGVLQNSTFTANTLDLACDVGVDLCRQVAFPQFAPYLALTWRSAGLAASKVNDYVAANAAFEEARARLADWRRNLGTIRSRDHDEGQYLASMFDEAQEQSGLGASGTAVRTVESLLIQWSEVRERIGEPGAADVDNRYWRLLWVRAYRSLRQGIDEGSTAAGAAQNLTRDRDRRLAAGRRLGDDPTYGQITEQLDIIVQPQWTRRPGIMTARCHLLAIPLCMMLRAMGATSPDDDWNQTIADHVERFVRYYRTATRSHEPREAGTKPDEGHQREVAQLRITFALLFPDLPLDPVGGESGDDTDGPADVRAIRARARSATCASDTSKWFNADLVADPVLTAPTPDVDELAVWLQTHGTRRPDGEIRPADANVICSISCDPYLDEMKRLNPQLDYVGLIARYPNLPREDAHTPLEKWRPELGRLWSLPTRSP